ncbi:hypothetical protein [Nereida sp. MMG025]|uniref:hypothetical protein n=1 Tax=Nereida sp. MMG025 TaxID=2909981 RepID=UPI001F2457D6|nr:hypothetical protein [Nereida sp. MMG025]MCF6446079.1 hypothetical protein [Nereida sp. MMG025]
MDFDLLPSALEVGTLGLITAEAASARYYRIAEGLARLYGITFCDRAEAQLIGQFTHFKVGINRSFEIADMDRGDHLHFLSQYLLLHGLSYRDVDEGLHAVMSSNAQDYTNWELLRGTITGRWDYEMSTVISEIQRLAQTHSVPTPPESVAEEASPGGTIIRGEGIDFPTCDPAEARAFRSRAERRVDGHYSVAAAGTAGGTNTTPPRPAMRYQVNKCGRREYSLRTDASHRSYAPLADGLAPSRPPRAKGGYAFACCILEAKFVGNRRTTLYQRKRDFLRGVEDSADALPRRFEGLGRLSLVAIWEAKRLDQANQFGAYLGAIADPDIPYWKVVYICSRDMARDYFRAIIRAAIAMPVAKACTSSARLTTGQNWIVL